ncbi:MAG: M56 family metallopeptidase [Planctomycetota bacterium]
MTRVSISGETSKAENSAVTEKRAEALKSRSNTQYHEQVKLPPLVTGAAARPARASAHETDSVVIQILFWGVLAWAVGSAILALWLLRSLHRISRIRLHRRDSTDPRLIAAARHVEEAYEMSGRFRVCEVPGMADPVSVGISRPIVLMPEGLAKTLDSRQLLSVLLHEAAHVVRRDPFTAVLQMLSQALFWWKPALRYVNGKISQLRELICDDFAIRHGGDGTALRQAILKTAEWPALPDAKCALTPMLLDRQTELEHRVVRLGQQGRMLASAMGPREYGSLFVFAFFLLAGTALPVFRTERLATTLALAGEGEAGDSDVEGLLRFFQEIRLGCAFRVFLGIDRIVHGVPGLQQRTAAKTEQADQ